MYGEVDWPLDIAGPMYGPTPGGNRPQYIIIHHSLTDVAGRVLTAVAWAATFHQYHVEQPQGPDSCPYHVIVSPEGTLARGRHLLAEGGHSGKQFNRQSVGLCLVGNFDVDTFEQRTLQVMVAAATVHALCAAFCIPVANVWGHREAIASIQGTSYKSCPGARFSMTAFRGLVASCNLERAP